MKANSDKSKQSNKATRRVLAGVLCGASVLSLVLSLVMPPISQAIANDGQEGAAEETVADESTLGEDAGADNSTGKDAENRKSDDAEGGEGEDAAAADPAADGAGAESAAQPADDGADDENSIALADVNVNGDIELQGDVTDRFTTGGSYCLTSDAWSTKPIKIEKDTKIDLAGHKLYYRVGNNDTFITVASGALTIEDSVKPSDKTSTDNENNPGRAAAMTWDTNNNGTLTYYVTTSMPSEGGFGTTETTTKHVVSGFGAIVAASDRGSVKRVVSVEDGGTLNLNGGMVTTPRALVGDDGHVIFSQGTVNISGGYVTNGSGGWGGGLCVTGAKAELKMTNGVIAANKAASGGGIYADKGAKLKFLGGVISGNATYGNPYNNVDNPNNGYGGGVFTKNANVEIVDPANITNNRVDSYITEKFNLGLLGGGGIASVDGGTLNMTGGSVTANYSKEAGGGIYAGFWGKAITFTMTGGTIAGNESVNGEGGGLRIAGANGTGTIARINAGDTGKIYITNNKTMTGSTKDRGGDWGGGGVFIQQGGKLNIVKTLITQNDAGGWGGGISACPTGETIVSHSNGAAIYNNTDHGYNDHMSAGGNSKNEDSDSNYITPTFKEEGHKDFFLVRKDDSTKTVAVVLGKMLGGGSAGWKGTCDRQKITIDPNGGAEAKYMFGLEAHPSDAAKSDAQRDATTIISGNYSYTHGGGIMTNGDLVVGEVSDLRVYPSMKLNATKVLVDAKGSKQNLNGHAYKFQLLRQDGTGAKAPSWKDDGTLDMGECSVAGEAPVDQANGNITFDSGKDYSSGQYVFYLVEEPISGDSELDTKFDKTIYKIVVKVGDRPSETKYLMSYPINYYKVEGVTVYKKSEGAKDFEQLNGGYSVEYLSDNTMASVNIGDGDNPTFTNKIESYDSLGSWTPAATKVVKGGEMKEFTLQLAKDSRFRDEDIVGTAVTSGDKKKQTLPFVFEKGIAYTLSDITKDSYTAGDSTGRGASKTFTYYMREEDDSSIFSHYKFDHSVYKLDVTMADQKNGKIDPVKVTYRKGTVDSDGNWVNTDTTDHDLTDTSTPTFTNTYSTSLPLSGMSGVTLTYLAGAAVLCAAAAWMHIRRKANAKGGERRE
ncbi:MAG: hypothetical protein UFP36_00245 [Collinsella sp.]|nr:hypothetical protein [Collinsella sp.]